MEMEMEMEVKRIAKRQKVATIDFDSDELEIISFVEEVATSNNEGIEKNLGNFNFDISSAFLFNEDRRYKKEDLKYNFLVLKWASWIKLSPFGFGVDGNSKNFPRFRASHKKWWGNGISSGWFSLATARLVIMILSTAHFLMSQNPDEKLNQMTMMIGLTSLFSLLMYALTSYNSRAQNMAPFLSSIFKYLDADGKTEAELQQKNTRPRKSGIGFGRRTFKELLIILFPFTVYSMAGMIPLLNAFDPSFPLLLVSLVQPEISFSFLSLAAADSLICVYYIMIIHMVFYILIGIHRIQEEAGLAIKNLMTKEISEKSTTTTTTENDNDKEKNMKIGKALKSLGLLHIWTRFFNRSFSNVIYAAKLIALSASISGGFGFIKMIEVENVPYAGIFGLLFLEGNVLYNIIFGRAFEIPEKVEDLKREIRKQSFKLFKYNSVERKYVERYLRSIPWLGVKDGVYKMERLTSFNFIGFGIQQITSLVLAH